MTDEERRELAIHLKQMSRSLDFYNPDALMRAAIEMERLADRVISLETAAELNLQQAEKLAAENDRLAALAQSDTEPVALRTQFEEWSFAMGHRNFTKSGGGYLRPDIQKDWLAFNAGAIVLPRPCASTLIEAAEWLEANNALWGALSVAKWLRARAAEL